MNRLTRRSFLRSTAVAASTLAVGTYIRDAAAFSSQTPSATPQVETSALEDLRNRLNGTLMLPEDSGYLSASAAANGRYLDIRPVAVARCADETDVVTCVQWCTENGVSPVPRGGGHSYAGFSTTNGLLIDLRRLNSVQVDWKRATVTSGGASLNADFFTATENGPLFLPGGTCLGVGVGGLTLGGGIGYNAHWAGLTCDHMQGTRVVTASGDILDVDSSTNNDLYWACRGGTGGTFGINTSFTFDLVDVPASVAYYRYEWSGAEAASAVLAAFDKLIQTAPAAFNGVAMAEATDVGDGSPEQAIHIMSRGQYIGPIDELRELVEPLLDAAEPDVQTLVEMPFWDMQRMIATPEPASHS
ncbi:MAG TPA: FAD-binding oxidoreductase, partial [Thermomicrobiales bacterium]|nr:FAD-binding oxidoreductase [Thermomicrobiales bacterium]